MKTRIGRLLCGMIAGLFLPLGAAAAVLVPEAERLAPPTQARVDALLDAVESDGFEGVEHAVRDAAFAAAAARKTRAMEGWLVLARWFRLLPETEGAATKRWVLAINAAGLGHANMAREWDLPAVPLSRRLKPDTVRVLLGHAEFSRTFFEQLTPYDHLPQVLGVLDELVTADANAFRQYHQLALAIALVSDMTPPPDWPHRQVSQEVLPRKLPSPVQSFAFWVASDRQRRTLHRLTQLPAGELKFLVSTAATYPELQWARQHARHTLAELPSAYTSIEYRMDRVEMNRMNWPGKDYRLPVIRQQGGICVDQAYYACEVGKAHGVPTLLFNGAGRDGRHAWFGYLDAGQRWRMDVGRYAEQRYVVGVATDPQTWGDVTDHELAFLTERFRLLPSYRQSRAHYLLAGELLKLGRIDEAVTVARQAVNHERRYVDAWDLLMEAIEAQGADAKTREATLREAARALQRYPDLNARFMRQVIATLRERGQESAAAHEERLLTQKFSGNRVDLAATQAAEILLRSVAVDAPLAQMRAFERGLQQLGPDAGMLMFDRLVRPFVRHLRETGRTADAKQAIVIARRVLAVQPGTQLDRELARL